jgi:hypothetical protein
VPTLTPAGFAAQFDTYERYAIRLESRSYTDVPAERAELRAFLAGELSVVREWEHDDWTRMVTRQTAAGRPMRRVRVMDDPLTDYNRFMIYCGHRGVAIGEDIRYLARADANALNLPDHDFWVFDSVRLIELRFTADGRPLYHDLVTDPDIEARHEEWIHRALAAATPSADYLADDCTRAWPPIRLGPPEGS